MPTKEELNRLQALPMEQKVLVTQTRIIEWYQHWMGQVYVSFSGGKDSTVLLHLVRQIFPEVPAVFADTGLEYPEIRQFAKSHENVTVVRPQMRFDEVIRRYGYPLISKEASETIYYARRIGNGSHMFTATKKRMELSYTEPWNADNHDSKHGDWSRRRLSATDEDFAGSIYNKSKYLPIAKDLPVAISPHCCHVMKKRPSKDYQHKNNLTPIIGTLAEESLLRRQGWMLTGCNAFDSKSPKSQPLSFWTEQDILQYIVRYNLPICCVYGDIVYTDRDGGEYPAEMAMDLELCKLKCTGCDRTGCIFCAFGFHNEKGETRFQRLARTHPKQYEYCMNGGQWSDNPAYDPTAPEYDGDWKNWNPKKIWVPSEKGLGMRKVFDMVNEIYGENFYRYE